MSGISVSLGNHFEGLVKGLVENGRYNNASEVVRDGLRMVEERERRLAALDAAVERSHADIKAGRTKPAEDVFDRLHAKYARMAKERGESGRSGFRRKPKMSLNRSVTLSRGTIPIGR